MFNDFNHGRRGHRHMGRMWRRFEKFNEHRMRRGDVKYALLGALLKRPMHGYDIMHELEEQSNGRYRPSAGSVYPTLQMLEDGGFVTSAVLEGKRVYSITDAGKKLFDERPREDEEAETPFGDWSEIRDAAAKFADAVRQGIMTIDPQTRERIRKVLDDARREIYTILGETK